jgi:hypothetical protein
LSLKIGLSQKKQVMDMFPGEASDGTGNALKNYFAVTLDKKPSGQGWHPQLKWMAVVMLMPCGLIFT